MNIRLPALLAHHHELRAGFEHGIRVAMSSALTRRTRGQPEEPDFVAMLVLVGVPVIADALRIVADRHGIKSRVTSVFCHQRPMVQFNRGTDACELGDILIVHRHSDSNGSLMRSNALLLQAKMYDKEPYAIPKADRHQLRLYEGWPTFTYVRTNAQLNGEKRSITPKVRHNGAQYLLIDGKGAHSPGSHTVLGHLGSPCMSVWPAEAVLSTHFGLADELIRLMVGVTGRTFEDRASADTTGWSQVVWDLLEHSVQHVFNRAAIGVHDTSRLGGDSLVSELSYLQCFFDSEGSPMTSLRQAQVVKDRLLGFRDEWQREAQRPRREPPAGRVGASSEQDNPGGGVSLIVIETRQAGSAQTERG